MHPSSPPKVSLGEIIGENPCSYEAIKRVLCDLLKQGEVGKVRHWIRTGFDSVPFRMAAELVQNILRCSLCNEVFDCTECTREEYSPLHDQVVDYSHDFGDILLVSGAGHLEKNLLLALFKFCDPAFMSVISDERGFKSKAAKDFINCGNHHVTWQILSTVYDALSKEIIQIYCYEAAEKKLELKADSFLKWKNECRVAVNLNYHFY